MVQSAPVMLNLGTVLRKYSLATAVEDTNLVRLLKLQLEEAGFKVWTDEGLEPGTQDWYSALQTCSTSDILPDCGHVT